VSKPGLDRYDRGAKVVAQALKDAGMEVSTPAFTRLSIRSSVIAIQEDVDVRGLSIMSGVRNNDHRVVEAESMQLSMVAEAKEGRFIESHTDYGYSFVYILEGGIIFEHDGLKYKLQPGGVLCYNASYSHSVTATGKTHKSISIFFKAKK
jgi:methylmalonyl-CoA mutase cobalamin-binding domain/chain